MGFGKCSLFSLVFLMLTALVTDFVTLRNLHNISYIVDMLLHGRGINMVRL